MLFRIKFCGARAKAEFHFESPAILREIQLSQINSSDSVSVLKKYFVGRYPRNIPKMNTMGDVKKQLGDEKKLCHGQDTSVFETKRMWKSRKEVKD